VVRGEEGAAASLGSYDGQDDSYLTIRLGYEKEKVDHKILDREEVLPIIRTNKHDGCGSHVHLPAKYVRGARSSVSVRKEKIAARLPQAASLEIPVSSKTATCRHDRNGSSRSTSSYGLVQRYPMKYAQSDRRCALKSRSCQASNIKTVSECIFGGRSARYACEDPIRELAVLSSSTTERREKEMKGEGPKGSYPTLVDYQ
jgi:hypothetical protein